MLQDVCASANIEVGSVRSSLNLQRKIVSSVDDNGDAVSATTVVFNISANQARSLLSAPRGCCRSLHS